MARSEDRPHPSPWSSIDRRLPLLTSLLLTGAITVQAAGAYRSLEEAVMENAEARLQSSAAQIASLLSDAAVVRESEAAAVAADPAVRGYASAPGEADRDAAVAALSGPVDDAQTLAVELWSGAGRLLATAYPRERPPIRVEARPPTAAGAGPIQGQENASYYEVVAPVSAAGSGLDQVGWVTIRRNLVGASAADALRGLIGADARLLLGNTAGGAWTDLRAPAEAPFASGSVTPGVATRVVDGVGRLGAAAAVAGSPWLVWVDQPLSTVQGPVQEFLRQLVGMGLLLLAAAAVVTYTLSRQVTKPLEQLTAAAEGLSGGDLEREVPVQRRDEVGRLARAFDHMRHQVAEATHRLEHRVEERTGELRRALDDLEEAQEELVRQERLAILGQLASGVGHELRNPLAVMTNALFYLDMVLEDDDPEIREYLGILRHQVGLSEKIVGDLLDFARIKRPQREALTLPALVDEQLSRLDLANGSRVRREFAADLPAAYGDPVQVGQVVLNLLTNAVQAMEDAHGTLTLSGRPMGTDAVALEVRDSGPGVPAELHGKVFEPLFTTRARGIGLGLAVSRRLAEVNGGSLILAGSQGEGAAFVLRLPRAPETGP